MASAFDGVLDRIKDDSVKATRTSQVCSASQGRFERVCQKCSGARNVELSNGDLNQAEFNELIEAQRAAAEQFVNTQAIAGQARARELTLTVLDIAVTKVAPLVIAAV
jgi:excinuclease UvrABC ATPase subunit